MNSKPIPVSQRLVLRVGLGSIIGIPLLILSLYNSCGSSSLPELTGSTPQITGGSIVSQLTTTPQIAGSTVGLVNRSGSIYCSGTLITPVHVITAAHCLSSGAPEKVAFDKLGKTGRRQILVKKAVPHPSYDSSLPTDETVLRPPHDLAILELTERIDSDLRPVAIAAHNSLIPASVDVAGFGVSRYRTNPDTGTLRKAEVRVRETHSSRMTFDTAGGTFLSPAGACAGDSGGPASHVAGLLYGVLSTGEETLDGRCVGKNSYTDLRHYQSWIESTLSDGDYSPEFFSLAAETPIIEWDSDSFFADLREKSPALALKIQLREGSASVKDCQLTLKYASGRQNLADVKKATASWRSMTLSIPAGGGVYLDIDRNTSWKTEGVVHIATDMVCNGRQVRLFPANESRSL